MAQMIVSGIALGAIYGLIALGIILVHKATGILNFAHGETIMVSTFVAFSLMKLGLPYWAAFLLTLVFAALFGLALEAILLRRFIGAPLLASAIACLGLYLILGDVAVWIWGKDPHPFPSPFPDDPIKIGDVAVAWIDLGIIGAAGALSLALYAFFRFTRMGVAMQATMANETAARLMGIPIKRVYALAWMLATVVGAVAGLLIAPVVYLQFTMMQHALHFAFAAAVLGGIGSMPGAMIGGIVIGIATNLTGFYLSSQLKEILPFFIMLAILVVRPYGLFARQGVKKV